MSDRTNPQAEHALRTANYIIDQWEMQREKVFALVTCLTSRLAPLDPKKPDDDDKIIEWNIALVIEDILSSTRTIDSLRTMAKGAQP